MSELVKIEKTAEKEVFAIKLGKTYLAVVNADDDLYFLPSLYESPLVACNAARAEKRKNSIKLNVKKKVNSAQSKKSTKIAKVNSLYTEEEMSSRPHLRFREVWVILNPRGEFVEKAIEDATLVQYQTDRTKAEIFKSYEDALFKLKTLDMVVKKGHYLRRFFEEIK
jgi:hypothetical protein